ncbi:hypothetical protein [Anabaena sp. CCY 9402-a]|uniref:hypothetical protein n=1 Tax=Anabaena sp. CCY 9402-a TaxID=3103867 RepID=UPI0039C6CF3F
MVEKAISKTSDWALNHIKLATPVRTGAMQAGWKVTPQRQELSMSNSVPYAGIVSRRVNLLGKSIPQAEKKLKEELGRIYDTL